MACTSIKQVNKQKRADTSSQYFGVTWNKQKGKWYARMTVHYKCRIIGLFEDEREAGIAYLKAAIAQWGPTTRIEDQKKLGLAI